MLPLSLTVWALLLAAPQDPERLTPLELSIRPDRDACALGEEIQLDVTLRNQGSAAASVAPLIFDERSVVFSVKWEREGKIQAFEYSILNGDPHIAKQLELERVTLRSGASFTTAVKLPAVGVGNWTIAAKYRGADKELTSPEAQVRVQPAKGAGADLNKLSAKLVLEFEGKDRTIWIDLTPAAAPNSVCQFAALAKRGFYNGLKVFSVVRRNWIRAGCPYNDGFGTPGFTFKTEAEGQPTQMPPLLHEEGTVALSQSMKLGYQGSQFFICLRRLDYLAGKFTIVGRVDLDKGEPETGSKVLRDAARVADPDKDNDRPTQDIVIKSLEIVAR
jgi:peptidyl-prolyl cis-trans isomerase B (cyclophilin B)